MLNNLQMYGALIIEVIMIVLLVYVPGLNRLFMLRNLDPKVIISY